MGNTMPTVHDITTQYQGVMVGLLMFVGFVQLTYGYRLKKLTFTTLGASAAGYGMYYLFSAGIITTEKVMVEIAITCVAAVLGGIFMFVLGNKLEKSALFSVGASSGLYGVYALRLVIPQLTTTVWNIENFPMWVCGIVAGLLVAGLVHFLKPDLTQSSNQRWIYLGIMVAVFLLGLLVQFAYTAPKEKSKEKEAERNLLAYEQSNNLSYGSSQQYRNNPVHEQA